MRLRMIKSGAQETTNSQGPMGAERAEQMKDKEWSWAQGRGQTVLGPVTQALPAHTLPIPSQWPSILLKVGQFFTLKKKKYQFPPETGHSSKSQGERDTHKQAGASWPYDAFFLEGLNWQTKWTDEKMRTSESAAHSVKCLLHKPEDLILIPWMYIKTWVQHAAQGRQRQRDPQSSLAKQSGQFSNLQV